MKSFTGHLGNVKQFVATRSGKVATVVGGAVGAVNGMAIKVLAADPVVDTAVTDSITSSFSGLKTSAMIALGAVSAIAIVLFAGPYVWRYGKKIFKVVSS